MSSYHAFRIHRNEQGHRAGVEALPLTPSEPGEVLIRVAYSSVNYKDALAGTGRAPIVRSFPRVGGIDAAGVVAESRDARFREGDRVLVTGWGLSVDHDGGYAEYLRAPADWVLPLPAGLDAESAMTLGTAGFTAALAVHRMQANGQCPALGPVLVTGASGGVGSIAVNLLHHLGYQVAALSGKPALADWLRELGADEVLARDALPGGDRPLERALWGGAIDNVGGEVLARITRTLRPWGSIAAVGLAGGSELHTTVMPFILRGVSLLGINSADAPRPLRGKLWDLLAGDWRPPALAQIRSERVGLDALPGVFERMLAGQTHGRVLVDLGA
ncbi:MAG: oxidoreductase [Chromatiaceae bacterium]|jgi:NADPH2:quinone reductase|nr:oxidoreductase [Chromatiaceae bacterium]